MAMEGGKEEGGKGVLGRSEWGKVTLGSVCVPSSKKGSALGGTVTLYFMYEPTKYTLSSLSGEEGCSLTKVLSCPVLPTYGCKRCPQCSTDLSHPVEPGYTGLSLSLGCQPWLLHSTIIQTRKKYHEQNNKSFFNVWLNW
ncbi:hypothetical protein M406DRAFT_70105 [Cryphonectria parasitica EP155]|uniref:Uncharacterized protein n=1 Tax=Cryphonectria parasitica (strain ATCC 38755 / EP155) TaxID=660469 RepID=A0A9P5CSC4_CRYP1|nr:uncharacterized protein M406DRAFT_70105 [Cryphonectria parasitica EP155]KAF3768005.1 hypothetical protein M406DRAFT_70105 [Cryphonectria parasitica EP155]